MNKNGLFDFTATIRDSDTGVVIYADFECELSCAIYRGELDVDYVFIRDDNHNLINLSNSLDPDTQRLVAKIREQALEDNGFMANAYDELREAA